VRHTWLAWLLKQLWLIPAIVLLYSLSVAPVYAIACPFDFVDGCDWFYAPFWRVFEHAPNPIRKTFDRQMALWQRTIPAWETLHHVVAGK
jgi:hypothetical protein